MYEFKFDDKIDFNNYWYFDNLFKDEEIEKIHSLASELNQEAAGMGEEGKIDDEYRTTQLRWFPQDEKYRWIYGRLGRSAEKANNELWHFNLTSMREPIQYSTYLSEIKGHYEWHNDIGGTGILTQRKVSCVVFLDEPGVDYEGGDFLINNMGNPWTLENNKKGTAIFFPSFWLHKVSPVTKGLRRTLVMWMGGQPYK
tara:strand:- start:483 stop:1076 length:594 start_codon:yes stop_codon:yes gene_type:complete